jgi:hypothetical protein
VNEFLAANALQIVFGIVSAVTSVLAIHYARRSYHLSRQLRLSNTGRSVEIFLDRESMISALLAQYDSCRDGEEIWAQGVGMANYPGDVSKTILAAAGRGIGFRIIVNANSPAYDEFVRLFEPIKKADMRRSASSNLRVQGMSDREVIVAFPTLTTYTAVRFTDKNFVAVVKNWFDERFNNLPQV